MKDKTKTLINMMRSRKNQKIIYKQSNKGKTDLFIEDLSFK